MGQAITTKDEPRIYVACLAVYNSGHLHGVWIDAVQEAWTNWDAVQDMLCVSPAAGAEEWAIRNYEGFGGVRIEEYPSFENVGALAAFAVAHGDLGRHCSTITAAILLRRSAQWTHTDVGFVGKGVYQVQVFATHSTPRQTSVRIYTR